MLNAILLACSLGFGALISTSNHATAVSGHGVVATLDWTGELRWQVPDDGGPRYKATLLGPSTLHVTGRGMAPQTLPLNAFLAAGHAYTPVDGPGDGCGATTNLAIIPKSRSALPYVVVFAVLAEKGCMAIPVVFVPMHTPDGRYEYVGAPYITMWSSEPKFTHRVRVASIDRVILPHATIGGQRAQWPVMIVVNGLAGAPHALALEPPNKPKQITAGSTILLGSFYNAWFASDPGAGISHKV